MKYKISPSSLIDNETIDLPASKSLSNRALILRGLCENDCNISHISDCDDTVVMLKAHSTDKASYITNGDYRIVDIGAAGTSMRFLTAFFAAKEGAKVIMTGSERMRQRPIGVLVDALKKLGAEIEYSEKEGYPPLKIDGHRLDGGPLSIDGSISSQYISALLMIAPTLKKGLQLELIGNITSIPYIKMTLSMMKDFGVESEWNGNRINVDPQRYSSNNYSVESDWSASSYWFEILALSDQINSIKLKGLFPNSTQGDCKIADYYSKLGIVTSTYSDGIVISKSGSPLPQKVEWDMSSQPDLAQTVIVTCCALNVQFDITGLHTLRIKETDRISALEKELLKLGFVVKDSDDDRMFWTGEKVNSDPSAVISTYDDHRMAMSFAPFALVDKTKKIVIDNPQVVSKSYPTFWDDLKQINFKIEEC